MYRVEYTRRASREFRKLPREVQLRIGRAVDRLASDPRPPASEPLRGLDNARRVRVGSDRVLYSVQQRRIVVLVLRIGHRRDIYRHLKNLDTS